MDEGRKRVIGVMAAILLHGNTLRTTAESECPERSLQSAMQFDGLRQ
jgi:hypothetical protein